ncbi:MULTISPECIES: 3'-5' exonuclease [Pectobacterium]|uniref:3'-5' exonuclease n=1 Tax=Pectobacterium TaxID=122277 RepID=UPI0019699D1A|nr:3'-5' exonuclease [Pectobacterium brasiliense]MBN3055165.1 3'-5' exonuclease [Pectobacterium brasiliense]
MMKNKKMTFPSKPILIVDVEGNGHTPPDLVEISILKFDPYSISEHQNHTWLIKPKNSIKRVVTRIHGIKNSDVASSPVWDDIKEEVSLLLEGAWFVAHNAKVDYDVIKRHIPEWEPVGIIDTLRLARCVLPNAPSHSLEKLMRYTGLLPDGSSSFHRASFDVQATSELFKFLIDKANFSDWNEVCKVSEINSLLKKEHNSPTQGELW